MTTLRNSSIELLRIVCMFFIVFHHYMVHMAFPEYNISAWGLGDGALSVAMLLNGFFCVAVNCFVLISGYYGIHFKLRGLFKLYITCAFYGLIGYFVHLYVDGAHIGRSILDDSLFAFSNSKWWFINCYIQLFVMAPFLNVAIEHLEKKKYLYVLLLFSFLNVYLGYIGMGKYFNQYGYSTAQMVYLYLIGAYLKKYVPVVVANYSDGGYSSSEKDVAYGKDEPWIIIKYGHSVLPIKELKKLAWWYMDENPDKKAKNTFLKFYVLYLRLIDKLRVKNCK